MLWTDILRSGEIIDSFVEKTYVDLYDGTDGDDEAEVEQL